MENFIKSNEIPTVLIKYPCDNIFKKGRYYLDNDSFIILVPKYLTNDEIQSVLELPINLDMKQNLHLNGKPESRLTHWTGPEYKYSDIIHKANDNWNPTLLQLKVKVEGHFLVPFNSVLVNQYTKNQSIPFHKDDEKGLQNTILSISAGESRNLSFQNNDGTKEVSFKLDSGTLCIMGGKTNINWKHSIPKGKKDRINLTYRFIKSSHYTRPQPTNSNHLDTQNISNHSSEFEKTVITEIQNLKNSIELLQKQVTEKDKYINELQKELNKYVDNNIKNDIVILKSPLPKTEEANIQNCLELINTIVSNEQKISPTDIIKVEDHRASKGPITIKLRNLSKKIEIIKSKSDNIVIKNRLSKENTIVRKRGMALKNKKVIGIVWDYKGEIFYKLPNSQEKLSLTLQALASLENGS